MRVLLVLNESVAYERLGVQVLSANLKKHGQDVRLVLLKNFGMEKSIALVEDFSPDVIGYSVMTGEHVNLLKANLILKKHRDFKAVFGGPHATFFPKLVEEEGVDAICVGEGDEAFVDFCKRLEEGGPYWDTPNFHVKHKGEIIKNPLRPWLADLNELPMPDRKLYYDADPKQARLGMKSFMAARGCPYKCSYCFNVMYNTTYKGKGKILRCFSPENVVRQIEWVRDNYPLHRINFIDDLFFLKPKGWIAEFCSLYKERVGLPFMCSGRANVLKPDDIAMMRDAGLESLWIGIESGDEKAANEILSRGLTNDQLLEATRTFQSYGIKILTQNLIGLPVPEPFETDLKTLDLNIKIKPEFGWSSILYPYPGTPIEAYAQKNGYLDDHDFFLETNKRFTRFHFKSELEKRKIENLHKLFGIIVRFPVLRPLANFLCSLPLSHFYRMIFYAWYGYVYTIKPAPLRMFKEFPYYINLFFRMVIKG